MTKIPVLMYHSIQGRNEEGSDCDYEIKEEDFEKQMLFLAEKGYSSFLFDDFNASTVMPEKGIVITFDDGHLSNYTIAFPILLKLGFRAVFFITSKQIKDRNRMQVDHLREMVKYNMTIGSHGLTHAYLDDLNDREVEKELLQSRESLSDMLGSPVNSFSAPGGRFKRRHIKIAEHCGYRIFCTSRPGLLNPLVSLLRVPRMPVCQGNVSDYNKIVSGDTFYYLKKRGIAVILYMAKKVLGNKHYEKIRNFILWG